MNDMFYLSLLFLIDSISMRLCKEIYMPYSESLQTYNITPYFWVLVMFEWLLSQYMDIAVVYQKIFIKSHWSYNVFPPKDFSKCSYWHRWNMQRQKFYHRLPYHLIRRNSFQFERLAHLNHSHFNLTYRRNYL